MIGIDKSQTAIHDSIIPSKPRVPPAAIVAMANSEMMKIRMLIILTLDQSSVDSGQSAADQVTMVLNGIRMRSEKIVNANADSPGPMASVMRPQMRIEAGMRAAAALRSIAPRARLSPENNRPQSHQGTVPSSSGGRIPIMSIFEM